MDINRKIYYYGNVNNNDNELNVVNLLLLALFCLHFVINHSI